jgi:hypothetical protein
MNLTRNTPLPPSIESDIEQLADGLDRCRTAYASAARHPAAASALYASCGQLCWSSETFVSWRTQILFFARMLPQLDLRKGVRHGCRR